MKKAIITGATGFIGSVLTKNLLSKGIKVFGVGVNADKLEELKTYGEFIPIAADFTQYEKLSERINEKEIDVFYHLAWDGTYGEAFKDYGLQLDNAKYACEALMQAVKIGCRKFVFAGTCNEFEADIFWNSNETESRYNYVHSGSKIAAEIICKTLAYHNQISYNAGLIAMVYGENNRAMMLPNVVIRQLLKEESPKLIKGDNLYDMIYVDDVAEAFYLIGTKGKNLKSYYVGHRKLKTFQEIFKEIGRIVNPDIIMKFGEYKEADNRDYSTIDLEELYQDTGFECKADFRESIEKTAEWLKRTLL